jgi:hypothetical protein
MSIRPVAVGICPIRSGAKLAREGDMVDGAMVLVLAFVFLAAIWAIVLYGSTYFGPR